MLPPPLLLPLLLHLLVAHAVVGDYTFSAKLSPSLTLEWSLVPATAAGVGARLRARLTNSGGGWASVGVNAVNAMGGTDAVLVEPVGAAGAVSLITMAGHSGVTTVPAAAAAHTLDPGTNFSKTAGGGGGGWRVEFSRALAEGSYAGAREIPASGETTLIAAWGGEAFITTHASSAVVMATINFGSGAFNTGNANLHIVHGAIMAAAWAVLVPGAAALVRYGYVFGKPEGAETRATRHMQAQCLAVLLTAAGAVVALVMTPASAHLATTHGVVGLFVVLGAFAQPCLGFCCFVPLAHKSVGYATMALGVAAMYLGLADYGAASLVTLFFVLLALAIAAVLAVELRAPLAPLLLRCTTGSSAAPVLAPPAEVATKSAVAVAVAGRKGASVTL